MTYIFKKFILLLKKLSVELKYFLFSIRIHFTIMNSQYSIGYDALLNKCIDSGVSSINLTHYRGICLFNNGVIYYFWNENRYYAWLTGNGDSGFGGKLQFNNVSGRPSRRTIVKFKRIFDVYSKPVEIRRDRKFSKII